MKRFLATLGLPASVQKIVVASPAKLAHSKLLDLLVTFNTEDQISVCSVIGRLVVVDDPSEHAVFVQQYFNKKLMLRDELRSRTGLIKLTPDTFVEVLDKLTQLDRGKIKGILDKDPGDWLKSAVLELKIVDSQRPALMTDQETFDEMIIKEGNGALFVEVRQICIDLEGWCDGFV